MHLHRKHICNKCGKTATISKCWWILWALRYCSRVYFSNLWKYVRNYIHCSIIIIKNNNFYNNNDQRTFCGQDRTEYLQLGSRGATGACAERKYNFSCLNPFQTTEQIHSSSRCSTITLKLEKTIYCGRCTKTIYLDNPENLMLFEQLGRICTKITTSGHQTKEKRQLFAFCRNFVSTSSYISNCPVFL